MPGGQFVNPVDDGSGKYRPSEDPRYAGTYAEEASGGAWTLHLKGGATWRFEPFAGIAGVIRGGPPLFLTRMTDSSGNSTTLTRQSNGRLQSVQGLDGRRISLSYGANGFADKITDHTGLSSPTVHKPFPPAVLTHERPFFRRSPRNFNVPTLP